MLDDTMSPAEMKAWVKRTRAKSHRTRQEEMWLGVLEDILAGNRDVAANRDHTPPKKKGWFS